MSAVCDARRGFVLITAMLLIALASLLAVTTFVASESSIQSTDSAHKITKAYYYAEAGLNYIAWALANGAEFDSNTSVGSYQSPGFAEPPLPPSAENVGDLSELRAYLWNPGPTIISDSGAGKEGQVKYFDNSPMGSRYLCFDDTGTFSNCINLKAPPAARSYPVMLNISTKLPRYIKLEISDVGVVGASIPSLPHRNPPVVGEDVPQNGAIVWLTAGDPKDVNRDIEIFPLDPANKYGGQAPSVCAGGQAPSCPCDYSGSAGGTPIDLAKHFACDANAKGDYNSSPNMGEWIGEYNIVAYSIGYVNGRATYVLRSIIK